MTYDKLLPVYRQITGLPGQDDAFNRWVQGIIDASGSGGTDAIPDNFFDTPAGQQYVQQTTTTQTPATGTTATGTGSTATSTPASTTSTGNSALDELLKELRLDPDFSQLPVGIQTDLANQINTKGLGVTGKDNYDWSQNQWQNGSQGLTADQNAALARWSQKATSNASSVDTGGTTLPLEQDILNQYLAGLLSDADHDTVRKELIAKLGQQAVDDFEAARNALSPEENARRLAEELAQADKTATAVSTSAATSAADQLKALQDSIAAMQGNLTGNLAAKAAALQAQIKALQDNLSTLDETQKKTLADQIATTQKDLETSIASQQTNLNTQINSLRTAVDANSVARRKALQDELDGLTAAQAPLAKARLDSANAQASGINLGLQSTQDQLLAQRAKQGYLGGSSFDNAAMARSAISARQSAAQALGNARELNAGDLRTIQAHGATEGRSIADELANNTLGLDTQSATGTRSLADLLATGTQTIGDTGAAGLAGIKSNTANSLFGINNAGANQGYQDTVTGADQYRSLADMLAKGGGSIGTTLAQQQQAARDAATGAKQGYFDNAYTRGQGGILARPTLSSGLVNNLTALDNYGNTGLNRLLSTLNWWSTGGQQAPTTTTVPVTADNSGNDLSGLGAGLLSGALKAGNAANWWQTPKTTATDPWANFNSIDFTNGVSTPA